MTLSISDGDLHTLLDQLLSAATADGKLDPDAFWTFVAALAQGRGIAEGLHDAGIEAATTVAQEHPKPGNTLSVRQERAYHIAFLLQLLADMGRLPGETSVLPGNFRHGAVVADLLSMLDGRSGQGQGRPQILYSRGISEDMMPRQQAQRIIVGAINWQAARNQPSSKRPNVKSIYAAHGLIEEEWDEWVARFKGVNADYVSHMRTEGRAGRNQPRFLTDPNYRAGIIKTARGRQRNPEPPPEDD